MFLNAGIYCISCIPGPDSSIVYHLGNIFKRNHFIVNLTFDSCGKRGGLVGGAVASWLVRSSPERVVRVRALAGDICFVLGEDTLLSQCLSPTSCMGIGEFNAGG